MGVRDILIMLVGLMPACRYKNWILRLFGWEIGKGTRISPVIVMRLPRVSLGLNVNIQPFSVFRDVSLQIDDDSLFGKWNWVSAAKPLKVLPEFSGTFKLGKNCAINSRNYFDTSGGISFGDFSDLAGVRSTFITHQISHLENKQTCAPIEIGRYTMICSNSIFVPGGTFIGERSVVAMGSVVTRGEYGDGSLFAGNPAKFKKTLSGEWFQRQKGPSGE